MIKQIDEVGNETSMTYDAEGNLLTLTDESGNVVSTNEYNKLNQVTKTTDVLGNETTYSYDTIGNLIKKVEYLNSQSETKYEYTYDKVGQLTKTLDPEEGISKYEYDKEGNITKQIDPNGGETTYEYDEMGRVISELNAIGSKNTYTYNALGLLKESENARGQKATYTYDSLGRIKIAKDSDGTISYTYDDNDNVEEVIEETTDGRSLKTTRTYDKLNRVSTVTDYKGNTVKYSYDELGNLISLTYPGGEIVRYDYYDNGYLYMITDGNNKKTVYKYDAVGNLIKTTRPNKTVEERTYDKAYRLVKQVDKDKEGNELSSLTYSYDVKGNITKTEGYKELEEDIDKLTSATMKYDKANRLIEYNGEEVKYDADGNMTYGPVDGKMTKLSYDSRNRLIKAGDITYEYDSENNKIAANLPEYREEYVWAQIGSFAQLIMVKRYEASGDNSSENKEYSTIEYEKATYYYGVGLEYETTSKGTYYHHYNNVGNTLLLTDKNSKVVEEYSYGVYGELLSGDASKTKFLYNGQLGIQTEESGLYYMRSRFYNPEIKRFINQDTLRGSIENSQSLNRYSYVQGNPVSLTDPFGTSPFKNLVQGLKLGADILMEMASIFVPGGIFVKAGYELLKGNGAQAIKDLAFNLVTGVVVGAVAGLVVKGGAKALGAIGRTIKNSKPGKALANTFQKAPKIFNGKNADKVDDFARGLSRNTNKVADDVAESVVKKSNKTDDVASKVGKGRKTGQGSIVPTVDRGNRTPRPTNYSYGVDDAVESGKEKELFLPDEFYNKNLPSQVDPGTKYLPKYDEVGNVKQIKMYDDYGRESGWVDYTNHGYGNVNSPHYHTTPHWHEKIYNAQYPDGMKIHHRTDINTPLGAK